MEIIDLRSDTFTLPTNEMRQAMANAVVGDDVFDEDPTIHELQNLAATTMGKEAALFVPSGTMGNLVSLLTHCQRGDEIILGEKSHIFVNEVGGVAALGGIHPHPVPNASDGTIPLEVIKQTIRQHDLHFPPTRLICLENSHNYCCGSPIPASYFDQVKALAEDRGLKIHLDGARIFNSAVALSVDVMELVRSVDSVMFCLSKGLSAPVGSLICGTQEWIEKARKWRKMVGGGMRQAGHLAAAGILALQNPELQIEEDHKNAKAFASGLSKIPGIKLDIDAIKTNIIFFETHSTKGSSEDYLKFLEGKGIKMLLMENGLIRAVFNRHIKRQHVDHIISVSEEFFSKNS